MVFAGLPRQVQNQKADKDILAKLFHTRLLCYVT